MVSKSIGRAASTALWCFRCLLRWTAASVSVMVVTTRRPTNPFESIFCHADLTLFPATPGTCRRRARTGIRSRTRKYLSIEFRTRSFSLRCAIRAGSPCPTWSKNYCYERNIFLGSRMSLVQRGHV